MMVGREVPRGACGGGGFGGRLRRRRVPAEQRVSASAGWAAGTRLSSAGCEIVLLRAQFST